MWEISPLFLLIICIEIFVSNYRHKKVYTIKETFVNFYLSVLNGGLDLLIRSLYLLVLVFVFSNKLISIENKLLYWFTLFILLDFMFYWLHRLEHYCRLFWAVHVTHHSGELMNFTVAFRASLFQPLYRFVFFIPLAMVGFKPIDILLFYSLTQIWTVFVHTEFIGKLGWLEYVFVTPSHHRVHHASNDLYLDKNMGMILIIWDRMFGTFQQEIDARDYEPIRYGLTTPVKHKHPVLVIFHEWISIWNDLKRNDIGWKTKLLYLLKPPGWSHDGSRQTSEQVRQLRKSREVNEDRDTVTYAFGYSISNGRN